MKYGNCFIFAIKKIISSGGYIIMRRSRHTWVPHFLWAKDIDLLEVEEFKPEKPVTNKFLRWFPLHVIIFKGKIRKGRGDPK